MLIRDHYSIQRTQIAAGVTYPLDFGPFASGAGAPRDARVIYATLDLDVDATTDPGGDSRPDAQWDHVTSVRVRDRWGELVRELSGPHLWILAHTRSPHPPIGRNLGAGFAGTYRNQIPLPIAPGTPLSTLAEVRASYQATSGLAVANRDVASAIRSRLHIRWIDAAHMPWMRMVSTFDALVSSDQHDVKVPGDLYYAGSFIGRDSMLAAVPTAWAAGAEISSQDLGLEQVPREYLLDGYERIVAPRLTSPDLTDDATDPHLIGTVIPMYGPTMYMPRLCNLHWRTSQGFGTYSAFNPQVLRQYVEQAGSGCTSPGASPCAPAAPDHRRAAVMYARE